MIERYNSLSLNIDVILSTKVACVGINLLSTNVAIIYDSDKSPSNDILITTTDIKREELDEVEVYRLLTKNSYEALMFERAI